MIKILWGKKAKAYKYLIDLYMKQTANHDCLREIERKEWGMGTDAYIYLNLYNAIEKLTDRKEGKY